MQSDLPTELKLDPRTWFFLLHNKFAYIEQIQLEIQLKLKWAKHTSIRKKPWELVTYLSLQIVLQKIYYIFFT